MGDEWPPADWTKATRADWDRLAEQTCRQAQERFDRMSDEDRRKQREEVEREWDGPISVSPAHFYATMGIDQSDAPPQTASGSRTGAMSRLGSWIAKKFASLRSADIRHS